jgi:DNA-binding NarL/FixJ family response regulator
MRWRVLVVRPWDQPVEPILDVIRRVGVEASHEVVDTAPALRAALERHEWDLVIYDPAVKKYIAVDSIYEHAPAAAVVMLASHEDMADELARVVAARSQIE